MSTSKPSNFEQNQIMNLVAGNPPNAGWGIAAAQVKLIEDEFDELKNGIATRNVQEVRDGIADVLVTVYGLAARLGIDADADHLAVWNSNMSKFDENMDDARKTIAKYYDLGVETYVKETTMLLDGVEKTFFVVRSSYDQTGKDGKGYPAHKFLKSINFKEPQFVELDAAVSASL